MVNMKLGDHDDVVGRLHCGAMSRTCNLVASRGSNAAVKTSGFFARGKTSAHPSRHPSQARVGLLSDDERTFSPTESLDFSPGHPLVQWPPASMIVSVSH